MTKIKDFAKTLLPKPAITILRRTKYELRCLGARFRGLPVAPPGTDLVGYEVLIEFMLTNNILSVEGDVVEIGTFLGGGAYKLSKFLEKKMSPKKLFVLDIFDPDFDWTANTDGTAMADFYHGSLRNYGKKSQEQVFAEVTSTCRNIVVLKGDSAKAQIPSEKLCFAFIDGNHDPAYVQSDFYLVWDKLRPGGAIAFHDYEYDLPQTTAKINELVRLHTSKISKTLHNKDKHVLFVIKKQQ